MMTRINESYGDEVARMNEVYGLDPALFSPRPHVPRSNRTRLNEDTDFDHGVEKDGE
jgi:hypothetical protein